MNLIIHLNLVLNLRKGAGTQMFPYMPSRHVRGQIYLFALLPFMSVDTFLHDMCNLLSFVFGR